MCSRPADPALVRRRSGHRRASTHRADWSSCRSAVRRRRERRARHVSSGWSDPSGSSHDPSASDRYDGGVRNSDARRDRRRAACGVPHPSTSGACWIDRSRLSENVDAQIFFIARLPRTLAGALVGATLVRRAGVVSFRGCSGIRSRRRSRSASPRAPRSARCSRSRSTGRLDSAA